MCNSDKRKRRIATSKLLLVFDYLIMVILFVLMFGLVYINFKYTNTMTDMYVSLGLADYCNTITPPCDLTVITVIVTAWAGQLGISSTAYYKMCRSDHKSQTSERIYNDLPDNIKQNIDMTTLITSIINTSD